MTDPLDTLDIAEGKRLSVVAGRDGLAAVPMVRDDGGWRRAHPGDGVAEALLARLAANPGTSSAGRFTLHSWAARPVRGERPMGVDQTNESVVVGEAAVVKWATHLQDGPHPAIPRLSVLREFPGIPTPWGLICWHPTDAAETVVAALDEFLPGAVDGWTWAVELITTAALGEHANLAPVSDVGGLIAELHAALSPTATVATRADAAQWRLEALSTLDTACQITDSASAHFAATHRTTLEAILDELGTLAGQPVIAGHGDLHVGQILRSANGFVVTDFDGNPVLPASRRAQPIPAALDVAGLTQSLTHAAIVAKKYTALEPRALAAVDAASRSAFLAAYTTRLAELGHAELYDESALRAFRVQQVLREIIYAARHLPRWMYVPDAALPALLDEGTLA